LKYNKSAPSLTTKCISISQGLVIIGFQNGENKTWRNDWHVGKLTCYKLHSLN